jgi:hypothetical protein
MNSTWIPSNQTRVGVSFSTITLLTKTQPRQMLNYRTALKNKQQLLTMAVSRALSVTRKMLLILALKIKANYLRLNARLELIRKKRLVRNLMRI